MRNFAAERARVRAVDHNGINHAPVDRFTIGHAAFGVLMGLGRVPWWGALIGAVGWELLERPLKRFVPRMFPHASQDTWSNSAFDAAAVMAGWGSMRGLELALGGKPGA